jgi:nucleoside-diphosphate-sugar epimerase
VKIALTGATGFVGRHVVAELESRGLQATLLTRASPPHAIASRHTIVRLDLLDVPQDAYEAAGRPHVLMHLAWGGLPAYRSRHHYEQELPAHYRFLKAMLAAGLPSLVVTGTCFEYGMRSGPLVEDMETRPANPYAYAKDGLRRQLEFLKTETPFAMTWARLFYMHGEGQSPTSLLPSLRQAVARGDRVFPMSGGEQLRDYLPVAEVARLLVDLALARRDHGIVNVCSGRPISVRTLVEGWIRQHAWPIELELGRFPYPDYEPMAFWGDSSKLERCLDAR